MAYGESNGDLNLRVNIPDSPVSTRITRKAPESMISVSVIQTNAMMFLIDNSTWGRDVVKHK